MRYNNIAKIMKENLKPEIILIEFKNGDVIITSNDNKPIKDNGDGSYDMPSLPL